MSFPGFPSPPSPGPAPSPGGHNLLSSTHADTTASTPVAGSLVRGNASGLWEQLVLGNDGYILTVSAGQALWLPSTSGVSSNIFAAISGATTTLNVLDSNYYVGAQSGVSTVNMPATPVLGQVHVIKDADGVAGASAITISGNGFTIDGQSTKVINSNYQSETLLFAQNEWKLI